MIPGSPSSPLVIPTYDSSGQAVHPDVIDFGAGNTWNGYRYWMSMTPFPNGNSDYENPSIIASNDGYAWVVPNGLTNPIDPKPATGFNADSDLVLGQDNKLYCFYAPQGTPNKCAVRSSSDGVTWSDEAELFSDAFLISPAVVWDGSQWVMWNIDYETNPRVWNRRTSASLTSGWSAPSACTINNIPTGKDVWHIDVYKDGDLYRALVVVSREAQAADTLVYEAWSSDGITWTVGSSALIAPDLVVWRNKNIYRASMAKISGAVFDIWYSAENVGGEWACGRITKTLTTP